MHLRDNYANEIVLSPAVFEKLLGEAYRTKDRTNGAVVEIPLKRESVAWSLETEARC